MATTGGRPRSLRDYDQPGASDDTIVQVSLRDVRAWTAAVEGLVAAAEYLYRQTRDWNGEADAQSVIGVGRAVLGTSSGRIPANAVRRPINGTARAKG